MKTLNLIILIFAITNFCTAQTTVNVNHKSDTITEAFSAPISYKKTHSQSAISQLQNHLSKNLVYPEVMRDYFVDGNVVIEVLISADGKLESSVVVKSLSPVFDQSVLNALDTFKSILLNQKFYEGASKILIPVHFSIGN